MSVDSLLARVGKTREDYSPKSKIGKLLHRGGVADTEELRRILDLPSYRWQDDPDLEELRRGLEAWLALPPRAECTRRCGHSPREEECPECIRAATACTCRGDGVMRLRPVQVAALQAIHDIGGMEGPIRVGGGKTLISYLAGTVIEAERPLLLLPAKLKEKTFREFALLRRHWVAPRRMHIISYELLSRDRGVEELNAYRPDLVIADEAHKLKNTRATCTKRLHRYLTKDNPDAKYMDMSGTVTKRSIMEYHHRLHWAIPDGLQALPRKWTEAKDWADAIDEKPSSSGRLTPGALLQMASDEEITELSRDQGKSTMTRVARQIYGRRLLSAPGVVGTEEQFDGAMPILLQGHEFEPNQAVIGAFANLREDWETPDGQTIDTPATLWAHARTLIQGFYYRLDPPPPLEWKLARLEWGKVVREVLANFHDIDSPLMVTRAVEEGRIPWGKYALDNWRAIRGTFEPNRVVEWLDDTCMNWVTNWAQKNRGVIWVHEKALPERLERETGIPYYANKGLYKGKMIEDETQVCMASIGSNSEGRNLQHAFSANLIVSFPTGNDKVEQMLGRTHRDGQEADEVTVDALLPCYEHWDMLRVSRRQAEYTERTMKQAQKLGFADIMVASEGEIAVRHAAGDPLWNQRNAMFFDGDDTYTDNEKRIAAMSPQERARERRGSTKNAK